MGLLISDVLYSAAGRMQGALQVMGGRVRFGAADVLKLHLFECMRNQPAIAHAGLLEGPCLSSKTTEVEAHTTTLIAEAQAIRNMITIRHRVRIRCPVEAIHFRIDQ